MTTGRLTENNGARGFTLLELLMVMLLVAMVLAAAVPSLRLFAGARPVLNTAARLVAMTDYARSQAVSEGREYRLNVDFEKGSFRFTARNTGGFENLGKEFGREFLLPEGVEMKLLYSSAALEETEVPGLRLPGQTGLTDGSETEDNVTVTFFPDGRTEPAGFQFSDRRGNVVKVVCPAPSERFRVDETGEDS